MFKQLLTVAIIGLSSSIALAEKVELKAHDGFSVFGDFTKSKTPSNKGVLMLHQCNAERSMYVDLAKGLSKAGISSMSLDFRGFGESIVEGQSIADFRAKAKSRKHYFEMLDKANIGMHREKDVEQAYQYLVGKLGDNASISIIGASCGGTQAVLLSQKHKPDSFIFFSSAMSDKTRGIFKEMSDVPALFIAAQEDGGTFTSLNKAFLDAKSDKTRMLSYKGNGHGLPLFKQDPSLKGMMIKWFGVNSAN